MQGVVRGHRGQSWAVGCGRRPGTAGLGRKPGLTGLRDSGYKVTGVTRAKMLPRAGGSWPGPGRSSVARGMRRIVPATCPLPGLPLVQLPHWRLEAWLWSTQLFGEAWSHSVFVTRKAKGGK